MLDVNDDDEVSVKVRNPKKEEERPRRVPKKLYIPRRTPSIVVPPRQVIYTTPDKTTCAECPCFPREPPYTRPSKLNPCLKSPKTLYELAAAAVDSVQSPEAFNWTVEQVAGWLGAVVGFPEYRECILDNHINGRRLLFLEDPSHLPPINIHNWEHIQTITSQVRKLFDTEWVRFARSVALPPRQPPTHCTGFESRTGPTWGCRQNWTRCDILRWMKILDPEPVYLDHWDLVWYHKPDYPRKLFARIPPAKSQVHIPHYEPQKEVCNEYLAPRKFRLDTTIPASQQLIWMEHRPFSATRLVAEVTKKPCTIPRKSRLDRQRITLKDKAGKDLILARRLMNKPKFLGD